MQLTEFKYEINKARWGIDVIVCIAATISLPLLISIWTFPLESSPLTFTGLLPVAVAVAVIYFLSSIIGKWVVRVRSRSFVWTAVAGALLCATVQVVLALPDAIEYHSRLVLDKSLTHYLIVYSAPRFFLLAFVLGGFSLIATVSVRLLLAVFRLLSNGFDEKP